jgi:4-diphosphocytidyl-2-C-methyl-D-erythritol kinase
VRLVARIPAKINLHLQVLGRRPDGFHELRTLLHSIDLFDDLTAESAPEGVLQLEVDPPGIVSDCEDNLIVKAAEQLSEVCEGRRGVRFRLHKRIPVGGGLGGGSADAAAALVLLDRLWGLELSSVELHQHAARLGSDVPFFLRGGLALCAGRGDEVYPLADVPGFGVVVAAPEVQIPTALVYSRVRSELTWSRHDVNVYAFAAGIEQRLRWETMSNDLQPLVLEGWPVVAEVMADLEATGPLRCGVSGSGAAAFAVYPDRQSAERARHGIGGRWWIHVGETCSRTSAQPVARPEEDSQ